MPSGRAALSWGLVLSLALHALWILSAPRGRPHVRRAPPAHTVELALVRGAPALDFTAVSPVTAAPEPDPGEPSQSVPAPAAPRARVRPRPVKLATAGSPPLPAAETTGRDLGALERTLRRIAATTELTPDERRRAMLVVLRTWEDPSRNESAEQLISALLRELHAGEDR